MWHWAFRAMRRAHSTAGFRRRLLRACRPAVYSAGKFLGDENLSKSEARSLGLRGMLRFAPWTGRMARGCGLRGRRRRRPQCLAASGRHGRPGGPHRRRQPGGGDLLPEFRHVLTRYELSHFVPFGSPVFSLIEQVRDKRGAGHRISRRHLLAAARAGARRRHLRLAGGRNGRRMSRSCSCRAP